MRRYEGVVKLAAERQPKHIVEIGVYYGKTAERFVKAVPSAKYTGFDLWEQMTPELREKEWSKPQTPQMIEVAELLAELTESYALIMGDTNETLPKWTAGHLEVPYTPADFVFIDGGHCEATVQNDLKYAMEMLTDDGIIVMDDYLVPKIEGIGCNAAVDELQESNEWKVDLHESQDRHSKGGVIYTATLTPTRHRSSATRTREMTFPV